MVRGSGALFDFFFVYLRTARFVYFQLSALGLGPHGAGPNAVKQAWNLDSLLYYGPKRRGGGAFRAVEGEERVKKVPSEAFHETPRANGTAIKEKKNSIALPGRDGIPREGL